MSFDIVDNVSVLLICLVAFWAVFVYYYILIGFKILFFLIFVLLQGITPMRSTPYSLLPTTSGLTRPSTSPLPPPNIRTLTLALTLKPEPEPVPVPVPGLEHEP